jgi:hypothetical protein
VRPYTPVARPAPTAAALNAASPAAETLVSAGGSAGAAASATAAAAGPESFDLLVKSYPRGRVSRALAATQPGQAVAMRGPSGGLPHHWLLGADGGGGGSSSVAGGGGSGSKAGLRVHLVVVAAGTGITPALQLTYAALASAEMSRLAAGTSVVGGRRESRASCSSDRGDDGGGALAAPLNAMAEGREEDETNADGIAAVEAAGVSRRGAAPPGSRVAAVTVLACNRAAVDIPLAAELAALDSWGHDDDDQLDDAATAATAGVRVRVRHLLSSAEAEPGNRVCPPVPGLLGRGRVSAAVLAPLLAAASGGGWAVRLAWCGPDQFGAAMRSVAAELGVDPAHCHEFG